MAIEQVRNLNYLPYICEEGTFTKKLPTPPKAESEDWVRCVSPHDRMFYQQTLASARRSANFKNYLHAIPQDSLDLILKGSYNHSEEVNYYSCVRIYK